MIIDCDSCVVRGGACRDCVMTVLLESPQRRGVERLKSCRADGPHATECAAEFDEVEQRAIDTLAAAGLVPRLRLVTQRSRLVPAAM